MTLRTKLEIGAGVLFAVLAGLYGYEALQEHDAVLTASVKAQALAEQQAKLDDAMKARDVHYAEQVKALADQYAALKKMNSQQIVAAAPKYIPLPQPIAIASEDHKTAEFGDAIVPKADIQPIAQAVLEGEQCKLDRAKCQADLTDWQAKDKLHSQEAEQWKTVAKGGSVWKRVKKAAIYIGIGAAAGYVAARH